MGAAQVLRLPTKLVDPETGELVDPDSRILDLEDQIAGHITTIKAQSRRIGQLERQLTADDPEHHPQKAEIFDVIAHWQKVTDHPNAKPSKDRFDLVRSRIKDGYELEQIKLALDGIGAYRYVVNAQRKTHGNPSQRYDQMEHALKGGQKLERFANLGHEARKQGWTEEGWPA